MAHEVHNPFPLLGSTNLHDLSECRDLDRLADPPAGRVPDTCTFLELLDIGVAIDISTPGGLRHDRRGSTP
jgi:hypothetical protein